jgi:hypothetical protein
MHCTRSTFSIADGKKSEGGDGRLRRSVLEQGRMSDVRMDRRVGCGAVRWGILSDGCRWALEYRGGDEEGRWGRL